MPRSVLRRIARPAGRAVSRGWPDYSRLFLVDVDAGWSVAQDMRELASIAGKLGVRVPHARLLHGAHRQAVFYGSQFALPQLPGDLRGNRIATAYFHGRPGTPGMPEFDDCFVALSARHEEIARIQVTHEEMHELVLASGIAPEKVFRIPIGVNIGLFPPVMPERRRAARAALGIPDSAFVVGSFQKDGVGFGEGLEPKLIKGPDVLVEALGRARGRIPDLHVLLTGPARGYVQAGLDRLAIPWTHRLVDRHEELGPLYHALDAYAVSSRQEGGPKAVLESMAAGVPLVSTRVGQASSLVEDGRNGWLVDVEDADGIAERLAALAEGPPAPELLQAARRTAEANAYDALLPLWRSFFEGFVELG